MEKTKFEIDLEVYFPEIYQLNLLGKNDPKLWAAIYEILGMLKSSGSSDYGEIKITFQKGRVNHITTSITK